MDVIGLIVNAIIAVVGIFIGRIWEKNDHRSKKDKGIIDEILLIVPIGSSTYELLVNHDFGDLYFRDSLRPLFRLNYLLSQPTNFFLHKSLEKIRLEIRTELNDFLEYIGKYSFVDNLQTDFAGLVRPIEIVERRIGREAEPISDDEYINMVEAEKEIFEEKRKKLNLMSTSLFEKYNKLISKAHKIL